MGVNAVRPFVPTADKISSLEIKNLEQYAICATTWIANKNVNVLHNKGCSELQVDLPIPDPEEDEDETDDDNDDSSDLEDDDDCKGKNCSGASNLTASAIAAITLAAIVL